MSNPNPYNEDDHYQASEEFQASVRYLWEAGLEVSEIEKELDIALEELEDF
jgi:hypothetical protein